MSSSLVDFSGGATTLAGSVETIHPTGVEVQGFPLALVLIGGTTTFFGPGRNDLGFDSFVEGVAALRVDISRLGYPVRSVKLGGTLIKGGNITGWSLIFSYAF